MSGARRIFASDPRFERDGLRHLTVACEALGGRGDITFFVPPASEAERSLPVVLLLHGIGSSHWAWCWNAGAHRIASDLIEAGAIPPMLLAMPSDGLWGEGSGYLRHRHADYERWIIDEVPAALGELQPQVDADSPLFVSGFSMGGYGALRLGARHPERFRAIGAHAAVTRFDQMPLFHQTPHNDFALADDELDVEPLLLAAAERLPPLRFDVPLEDANLLEPNRALHCALEESGIEHDYAEAPGIHEWDFCERQLPAMLRFFAAALPA